MNIPNDQIIGRDNEVKEISSLLKRGTPVVITGEPNSGTSTVLKILLKKWCNERIGRVCSLSAIRNEKPLWQELAFQFCADMEETKIYSNNTKIDQLSTSVSSEIRQSSDRIFVFVDNLNSSLSSGSAQALGSLIDKGATLLVATHSRTVNKDLISKMRRVELGALSKEQSFQMIEELTERKNVDDPASLKKILYQKTRGLPGLIKKAIDGLGDGPISPSAVQKVTVQASEQVSYMYPWISIMLIAFLGFNRYVSRVVVFEGGRVDYVLGAIGFMVILLFGRFAYPFLRKEK